MHLSIRQLTTFREVMRSGSISQAAKTVARTQPAVSTMIATLEKELGFALFLREHGKLSPTPEAHYFLEEAEAVLERVERTKRTLTRIGTLERGKLRIACHPAASGFFMPRLLTQFVKDKPDIQLALIMRSSGVIEDLIASQQYDIGFAETPEPRASIDQTDFELECVCVMRRDDPLAAHDVITPALLDGKPMSVLFEEHTTATQTEAAFLSAGCRFHKYLELRTFLPSLQFVSEGLCYVVCDMITAYSIILQSPGTSSLTLRRFTPRITNSVSILTPGYATQALTTQAFITHLTGAVEQMQHEIGQELSQPTT
ncbi:LysR family transcriptional regulator [Primorskyibacter aestuariivivens]|uniref:LysR family transcriptional regulator n=1 Tax=Primorskyibacter aestuariivivens TaxID=1888912 RepID=UPI002300C985|nr:LysR family transcriptional regulator [Primorskyibacter aestuariivivens]MDA7430803.1 LysR family transcriptional regulator [Primorskyibacter aestuariivivens]